MSALVSGPPAPVCVSPERVPQAGLVVRRRHAVNVGLGGPRPSARPWLWNHSLCPLSLACAYAAGVVLNKVSRTLCLSVVGTSPANNLSPCSRPQGKGGEQQGSASDQASLAGHPELGHLSWALRTQEAPARRAREGEGSASIRVLRAGLPACILTPSSKQDL